MDENTEEEYDEAFQLGCTAKMIKMSLVMSTDPPIPTYLTYAKLKYFRLQGLASRFGIMLPDQPQEERAPADERKQFFFNQLDYVERDIRSKSQHTIDMFCTGKSVEGYITCLLLCEPGNEVALGEYFRRELETCVAQLQATARMKDIDLRLEINMANAWLEGELENHYEFEPLIRSRLQNKLGKREQFEEKRSEIDPTRFITNVYWAISIVRLPDKSREHAFLVIEGTSGNTLKIWFADFVVKDILDLFRPGYRDGKVRLNYYESTQEPGVSNKLLFRCEKQLMNIQRGDRLVYSTWHIPKPTAEKLVRILERWKHNPPKYNILGNTILAASTASLSSSSNRTGHNSFTFIRMVLRELRDDYIIIPESTLEKWIFCTASRYLVDKERSDKFGFGSILIFLASAVTAVFLVKRFYF